MLAAMDKPELIGDPRFDSEEERNKNAEEATQIVTEWPSKSILANRCIAMS